ncbi:putative SAC3/GANP family protein [Blattamonas nauphoetae]|uniref:SAC3/GANP family protein n=1 Tax=Blattamonas nauphoetae TaxID=2049346 RepID=A0ABQ9YK88_9EUKA|nr:putative SAC3/GANP family protein [Blattamonas nauphoetae]
MCPPSQREYRIETHDVDILEQSLDPNSRTLVPDKTKFVKKYERSAADKEIKVENVRPEPVLVLTTDYILSQLVDRTDVSFATIYSFVRDHMRKLTGQIFDSEAEFRAYHILLTLESFNNLYLKDIPSELMNRPEIALAVTFLTLYQESNFLMILILIGSNCNYLTSCLLARLLPSLRSKAYLQYRQQNQEPTDEELQPLLLLDPSHIVRSDTDIPPLNIKNSFIVQKKGSIKNEQYIRGAPHQKLPSRSSVPLLTPSQLSNVSSLFSQKLPSSFLPDLADEMQTPQTDRRIDDFIPSTEVINHLFPVSDLDDQLETNLPPPNNPFTRTDAINPTGFTQQPFTQPKANDFHTNTSETVFGMGITPQGMESVFGPKTPAADRKPSEPSTHTEPTSQVKLISVFGRKSPPPSPPIPVPPVQPVEPSQTFPPIQPVLTPSLTTSSQLQSVPNLTPVPSVFPPKPPPSPPHSTSPEAYPPPLPLPPQIFTPLSPVVSPSYPITAQEPSPKDTDTPLQKEESTHKSPASENVSSPIPSSTSPPHQLEKTLSIIAKPKASVFITEPIVAKNVPPRPPKPPKPEPLTFWRCISHELANLKMTGAKPTVLTKLSLCHVVVRLDQSLLSTKDGPFLKTFLPPTQSDQNATINLSNTHKATLTVTQNVKSATRMSTHLIFLPLPPESIVQLVHPVVRFINIHQNQNMTFDQTTWKTLMESNSSHIAQSLMFVNDSIQSYISSSAAFQSFSPSHSQPFLVFIGEKTKDPSLTLALSALVYNLNTLFQTSFRAYSVQTETAPSSDWLAKPLSKLLKSMFADTTFSHQSNSSLVVAATHSGDPVVSVSVSSGSALSDLCVPLSNFCSFIFTRTRCLLAPLRTFGNTNLALSLLDTFWSGFIYHTQRSLFKSLRTSFATVHLTHHFSSSAFSLNVLSTRARASFSAFFDSWANTNEEAICEMFSRLTLQSTLADESLSDVFPTLVLLSTMPLSSYIQMLFHPGDTSIQHTVGDQTFRSHSTPYPPIPSNSELDYELYQHLHSHIKWHITSLGSLSLKAALGHILQTFPSDILCEIVFSLMTNKLDALSDVILWESQTPSSTEFHETSCEYVRTHLCHDLLDSLVVSPKENDPFQLLSDTIQEICEIDETAFKRRNPVALKLAHCEHRLNKTIDVITRLTLPPIMPVKQTPRSELPVSLELHTKRFRFEKPETAEEFIERKEKELASSLGQQQTLWSHTSQDDLIDYVYPSPYQLTVPADLQLHYPSLCIQGQIDDLQKTSPLNTSLALESLLFSML